MIPFNKKDQYRFPIQMKVYSKIFGVQLKQLEYEFKWKQMRRVSLLNYILIKAIRSPSV